MTGYEFILKVLPWIAPGGFALGGVWFAQKMQSADRKAAEAETMQSLRRTKAEELFQAIENYRTRSGMEFVHFLRVAFAAEFGRDQPEAPQNAEGSYARIKALTLMYFPRLKPIITKYEEDRQQRRDKLTDFAFEEAGKPDGLKSVAAATALSAQADSQFCDDLELALVIEIEGLLPNDSDSG